MKIKSILLSIDVVVQLILLILLVGTVLVSILSMGATVIFVGLALFLLGFWQVGSGILFGLMQNDEKRGNYILQSVIYICALFFGGSILDGSNINVFITWFIMILFFLVIPSRIAIWYYQYSKADLEKIRLELKNEIDPDFDDILDSEEILRHEKV